MLQQSTPNKLQIDQQIRYFHGDSLKLLLLQLPTLCKVHVFIHAAGLLERQDDTKISLLCLLFAV